jgi:hypothetical protein
MREYLRELCIECLTSCCRLHAAGENQAELFDLIRKAAFKVPIFCSPEASDLVHNFLQVSQELVKSAEISAW